LKEVSERLELFDADVLVRTYHVMDKNGENATLVVFRSFASPFYYFYQQFGSGAYLCDEYGNMLNQTGHIVLSRENLAFLINKAKRGESFELPNLTLIGEIFEDRQKLPESLSGLPEDSVNKIEKGSGCDCDQ
jgi:hypothetical protein